MKCGAQAYKTKVLKKVGKVDVDGIEIRENPIGRGAELCQNVCFCRRTPRKVCFLTKTIKMTTL